MSALEEIPQIQQPMAGESLSTGNIANTAPPLQGDGGALAPVNATPAGGNKGWSGVVEAFGRQVEVRNGVADFDGEKFFVSDDGVMVIDEQDMIVGKIENGQFIEADEEYLADLRAKGMIEGE